MKNRRITNLVLSLSISILIAAVLSSLVPSSGEEKLYTDVYQHIDELLMQLDRNISEKLTDIRMTRQQIDQSMGLR